jgi:proline iminopeptidase
MAIKNSASTFADRSRADTPVSILKDHRMGLVLASLLAAFAGVLVALMLPRGPVTQSQALIVLLGSVIVGVLAGLLMQSRWAILLVPVVHVIALEVFRAQLLGPTVGALRFNEVYGVLAFLLGRGFYGLIAIVPMVLGAYLGTVMAHEMTGVSSGSSTVWRWIPTVLSTLTVVALAVWIALPASTPPILDAAGNPVPGSIAELTTVRLGGQDQTIMVRAYSPDRPVLLYLNGGPGQSGLPYTRVILSDLSRDFVIVDWDQRGTGKSYATFEPGSTMRLERAITDTLELANYLRQRFAEQKIYIMGESWGSILGVLAVQRQPSLFHAFIGSGQMVSVRETDRRIYKDVLELAARTDNAGLTAKMLSYGQPPYADTPYANVFAMGQYDALYKPYRPSRAYMDRGNKSGIGFYGIMASEYNLVEKINVLRGLIDTFTVMYPQLQEIDFRQDAKRLEVPVYILDGTAELSARRDLMLEWFAALEAPKKKIFPLENAAHSVAFEQFEAFEKIMLETVLPETYPGR